ncbi:hypothetical protein DZA28_11620 [Pseudomonas alloputida]|uniref:DUF1534 domain-containing protein n=1 Tax=Pseudomonas alloputida TaxID=1940621 RepID=A0ABY3D4I9_9PSED|nr:hypothetical protein DZA28_11620 [Pseudomonas alloputida]
MIAVEPVPASSRVNPRLQRLRGRCRSGFTREEAGTGNTPIPGFLLPSPPPATHCHPQPGSGRTARRLLFRGKSSA